MTTNQVVVVPHPGRGHINPMLNLCNLLSSRINHKPDHTTFFTIVLTEEWLGLINPEADQVNIRFVSIPNVLPSERNRGSDMPAFLTAVNTKMGDPFEEMLDKMEVPVKLIIFDATMNWPCGVAKKRNIPLAMYWPMSALMFSVVHYVDLIESHNQLYADVSERGKEPIDYIPGISSLTIGDLPTYYHDKIGHVPNICDSTKKSNYVLLSTMYELESKTIDALRVGLQIPVYTSGPNIPHSQIKPDSTSHEPIYINWLNSKPPRTVLYISMGSFLPVSRVEMDEIAAGFSSNMRKEVCFGPNIPHSQIKPDSTSHEPIYINWLNSKPPRTVLYISMGSFLPVSRVEMDEIAAGLTEGGINFLWVARGETSHFKDKCGENGMVVEWCDQLRVLSHSSIGGFWTHCGWNSVKESLFSGVPMLTFPILLDQPPNSKSIIEDWKIGKNMRKEVGVFKRDQIAQVVRAFMDSKTVERIEMMERVNKVQKVCQESVVEDGSAHKDLDAFLKEIVMDQIK